MYRGCLQLIRTGPGPPQLLLVAGQFIQAKAIIDALHQQSHALQRRQYLLRVLHPIRRGDQPPRVPVDQYTGSRVEDKRNRRGNAQQRNS